MKFSLLLTAALAMPQMALALPSFVPLASDDSIVINMDDSPLAKGEMWQRCAEGQTWSGGTCTGTATNYTNSQLAAAVVAANAENGGAGRGGYNDWRQPSYSELYGLHLSSAGSAPYTHVVAFPNTPSSALWTDTRLIDTPFFSITMAVNFGSSNASDNATITSPGSNPLRLVRGDGTRYTATATAQPPESFSALTPTERTLLPQASGTTFSVTPQPGWQVNSASTSATDGSCKPFVDKTGLTDRNIITVLNMQSDCAIAITLARIPGVWRITAQQPPTERGSIACPATVSDSGPPATCTASPAAGWQLAAWGDDCASATTSGNACTLPSPGRDATVSARFVATTALGLSASPTSPSAVGTPVTFTVTLGSAVNATGDITISDGTAPLCTITLPDTACTATPSAGAHNITASYPGDADNAPATSPTLTYQVNATPAAVPTLGAWGLGLMSAMLGWMGVVQGARQVRTRRGRRQWHAQPKAKAYMPPR